MFTPTDYEEEILIKYLKQHESLYACQKEVDITLFDTVNTTGNDLYRAAGFVMQTTMVPSNHLHVMECGFESPICQTTREIPQNQSGGVIRQLFGLKCKSVRLAFLEFPSSLQWSFL